MTCILSKLCGRIKRMGQAYMAWPVYEHIPLQFEKMDWPKTGSWIYALSVYLLSPASDRAARLSNRRRRRMRDMAL